MQGKSAAEIQKEVCPWLHTSEYPDPPLAFQPRVGWGHPEETCITWQVLALMKDLSFRTQGEPYVRGGTEALMGLHFFHKESSPPGRDRRSVYNTSDGCCVNAGGKGRCSCRLTAMQSIIEWKKVIFH